MTSHLPECSIGETVEIPPMPGNHTGISFNRGCICDRLRACEQRVRTDAAKVWEQMSYDTGFAAGKRSMHKYLMADDENVYAAGYRDGVQAARDAVEAVGQQHPKWDLTSTHYEDCWKHHSECALTLAIAAIDALVKP